MKFTFLVLFSLLMSHSVFAGKELRFEDVPAPQNEEVCFSPDERCDLKLVKLISTAEKSIDLAIFDLGLDQVGHQLLVKSRKIPVRVVVDRRQAVTPKSIVKTLIKGGVKVRFGTQRGIMHNKFMIVDGKLVATGSFNFTYGAAEKNQENQIYLTSPQVLTRYQERFEKIWNTASQKRPAKLE